MHVSPIVSTIGARAANRVFVGLPFCMGFFDLVICVYFPDILMIQAATLDSRIWWSTLQTTLPML